MLKNVLLLDDGSEIVAGKVGQNAILSLSYTAMVSSTTDLGPCFSRRPRPQVWAWIPTPLRRSYPNW